MNTHRLLVLALILGLLLPTAAAAAPLAGPCVPGATYDSACDANQDGNITVTDIQLTAGHWNQTGTFVSDNNHDHSGQTWTGSNNPLKIQGASGAPDYAALVLNNTTGHGLAVTSAAIDGVYVGSAGYAGVWAGTTQASGQWGFYTPDRIFGTIGMFSAVSLVGQFGGPDGLTAGDLVAVAGLADPLPGSTAQMPLVRLAGGTFTNVVGVVESHLALTPQPSRPQAAEGATRSETPATELRSVDGPAQTGDYVAITVLGAAQVKVDTAAPSAVGQRLTVAANGRARPLGTIKVQLAGGEGTADLPESAPVIGVAMEAAKDGLVWIMVNPQ